MKTISVHLKRVNKNIKIHVKISSRNLPNAVMYSKLAQSVATRTIHSFINKNKPVCKVILSTGRGVKNINIY